MNPSNQQNEDEFSRAKARLDDEKEKEKNIKQN
jgi:hypothetical protein